MEKKMMKLLKREALDGLREVKEYLTIKIILKKMKNK